MRNALISRVAVNTLWIANSIIIMDLIANQKNTKGEIVDCFAISGIPIPFMVRSTWNLLVSKAEFIDDGYLDIKPEYEQGTENFVVEEVITNFSMLQQSLCLFTALIHLFLILGDLLVLLNNKKYEKGIEVGRKLRNKSYFKVLFCIKSFLQSMTYVEPLIILYET